MADSAVSSIMAIAHAPPTSLADVIDEKRPDDDPAALLEEVEYFRSPNRELVGLKDDCETAVYYDRITCDLVFVPVTTDTVHSAKHTRTKFVGHPVNVADHAAEPDAWDWRNPGM